MSRSKTKIWIIFIGFCLGLIMPHPLPAQIRNDSPAEFSDPAVINPDHSQASAYEPMLVQDTLELLPWLKQDFMINELAGDYGCEQWYPNIASDSSGNYAIAWNDQRNGRADIYVQFFNNRDERIGANILVNDQECSSIYFTPFIAANKRGDFMVAWSEKYNDVVVQKFTSSGVKSRGEFNPGYFIIMESG